MATSAQGLLKAETAYYDQHAKELLLTYPKLRVDPRRPVDWRLRAPFRSRGRGRPPVWTRPFPDSANRRQAAEVLCVSSSLGPAAVTTPSLHSRRTIGDAVGSRQMALTSNQEDRVATEHHRARMCR